MKHYVTLRRTQKITYCVEARNLHEARETALHMAREEKIPSDISDAEYEVEVCISHDNLYYLSKIIEND